MTTTEELFRTAMLANAGVSAALPGGLWHIQLPQNVPTFPAASFQRVSTTRSWVHAPGGQFSDSGWCRFQVDIWSNTETSDSDVISAGLAITQALRTFNAYSTAQQGGSNRVLSEFCALEPDTQPPMFRYTMDLQIWFSDNT